MIEIYLQCNSSGLIKREQVGAWIYSLLGTKYHDLGVGTYFNGSKVKIHNYYVEEGNVTADSVIKICIRGLEIIESTFLKHLSVSSTLRLGGVSLTIKDIVFKVNDITDDKNIFEIKSPILIRNYNLNYKYEIKEPLRLEDMILNSIKRKYKEVYNEPLFGLKSISFIDKKETFIDIKIKGEIVHYKCYVGYLYIEGTDEAKKFIKEVGLGNRTSYGLGYID